MSVRRTDDHRIREAIVLSGNPNLFPHLKVPPTTARTWIKQGTQLVVTLEPSSVHSLRARLDRIERELAILRQVLRLLLVFIRVSGTRQFDLRRLPEGTRKNDLLAAIGKARQHVPLAHALRVLGLSPSRYHAWTARQKACSLDDRPSCPRSRPGRLTFNEVTAIGDMVTSPENRHMSIRALALHAQRTARVFAHPITWGRLIRDRGWRRPRLRVYPARPKIGVKATTPNEIWHIDASIMRLVDGTRVYLHAVIDNFSRRILGWRVEERLNPMNTFTVLSEACAGLDASTHAQVYMDAGVENLNGIVNPLFEGELLKRVLAQVDVTFSNSMIEAWWRSLKHQWLYLHQLDNIATVRRLVGFYVQQNNEVMPHSAFSGQTPHEMYFGQALHVVERLAAHRTEARSKRLIANQLSVCPECPRGSSVAKTKARTLEPGLSRKQPNELSSS